MLKRTRRRNSEINFNEVFIKPMVKGLSKTEMNYAHGVVRTMQDLLQSSLCSVILAKNLVFKELGREVTNKLLRYGVLRPLHNKA
jgi:hypothetical protein